MNKEDEFFAKYKPGESVSFRKIVQNFNLSIEKAYLMCEKRSDLCIFLKIYCSKCNSLLDDKRYKTIGELPERVICPNCGHIINNVLLNSYVFYEKI